MKIGHAASGLKQKFAGLGREIWKRKLAYLFIAPLIIGLLIFSYYPPVYGLTLSFFEKHSVGEMSFVGFRNYIDLFHDSVFLRSIPTMFAIMIPRLLIGIVVPLVMAELIFGVKSQKLQSCTACSYWFPSSRRASSARLSGEIFSIPRAGF